MQHLFPSWPLLAAFLAASLALALTPGPAVLYIVSRSIAHGRGSGLASVAGVAVGNFGNAIGASLGLAALFALSSMAFTVVKYAGAAYLIYLGIRALTAARAEVVLGKPAYAGHWRVFADGFWVALLNPKTALFFAAFLPQFCEPGAGSILQSAALGTLFVVIAAITDSVYALVAGTVASALARRRGYRKAGRYLAGGVLIGLGVFTAVAGTRTARRIG